MKNFGNYPKYRGINEIEPLPNPTETPEQKVKRLFGERLRSTINHDPKTFLDECRRRVAEDKKRFYSFLIAGFMSFNFQACARNWVNYPPVAVADGKGGERLVATRAAEFSGSDLIGGTTIDVSHSGVHVAAAGGINNSVSTEAGYRTVRYGIGGVLWTAGAIGVARTAAGAASTISTRIIDAQ